MDDDRKHATPPPDDAGYAERGFRITNYFAHVVFAVALGLSTASLAMLYWKGLSHLWLVGVSALVNVVSILASESGRLSTTRQMRRAYEPRRAFNGSETLLLLAVVMLQIGMGLYVVLAPDQSF